MCVCVYIYTGSIKAQHSHHTHAHTHINGDPVPVSRRKHFSQFEERLYASVSIRSLIRIKADVDEVDRFVSMHVPACKGLLRGY